MAGVWRKTLMYLGLVEEDEMEPIGETPDEAPALRRGGVRRLPREHSQPDVHAAMEPSSRGAETLVRTIPRPASAGSIHRAEPKRFNEARDLGEKFKDGVPVIMNLQSTEDSIARRLVDFASGLVFGLGGKIELVATRVYLLTPAEVEVSAEERERLREGGFYNQF